MLSLRPRLSQWWEGVLGKKVGGGVVGGGLVWGGVGVVGGVDGVGFGWWGAGGEGVVPQTWAVPMLPVVHAAARA